MNLSSAVYCYTAVSSSAREAVRYAIAHSPTSAVPATITEIQQVAIKYATGLDPKQLDVTVTWPADPNLPKKNDAQVVVNYQYQFNIPFISTHSIALSSTSRMLVSQ
jgi:Flp pilus assembly protein TadG